MANMSEIKRSSYVVVPQGEYEKLYNRKYAELTTLKKIDPEENREKYLETALKTHYPKVYKDMVKNDYILTNPERIQNNLDNLPNGDYEMKKQANLCMHKQLNEVISGKQNKIPLSNPMRLLAQDFIDDIANDSTVSPEKRKLLHTHLAKYLQQIPLYLKKKQNPSKTTQHKSKPHLLPPPPLQISKELQTRRKRTKRSWLKKQIQEKKGLISLSSPIGLALSREKKQQQQQESSTREKVKRQN